MKGIYQLKRFKRKQSNTCTGQGSMLTLRTTQEDARNASSGLSQPRSLSSLMTYQRGHGGKLAWIISTLMATHIFLSVTITQSFPSFLGGLSLHLNHLIASHVANYNWPFGTLPFGLFGSNLDTGDLETYPRTYSVHF